ncbi:MAG: HAMP domain-containing sensor histidine kinase [Pseudomonadota bacterium]
MDFDMLPGWANKISNFRLSSWIIVLFGGAVILPWFVFGGVILAGRDQRLDDARHNLGILAIAYGEGASVRDKPEPAELRRATALSGIRLTIQQMQSRPGPQRPGLTFAHANGAISAKADFPAAGIAAIASQDDDTILVHWRQTVSLEALGLAVRSVIAVAVGLFLFLQLRWRENTLSDLAKARIAAEGSNMAKANFLANMSHELRTPLNAILGFSEIIKSAAFGPIGSNYREYAGDIHSSGTHLLSLINEVLDLSKLEAGQFELVEQHVNLADLVESSTRFVEPQAQKGRVGLSHSIEPAVSLIRADERRMRQILINILANAVKFTPPGGQVGLVVRRTGKGLLIQISDTGIGIPADKIEMAMEPFSQVEAGANRHYQGTGLGLPLAKRLVELHGGTLSLESEVSQGTVVSILLPPDRILNGPDLLLPAKAAG